MATIVLAAAGGAVGASIGGSVLGLSSAVIGRAVGASIGRAIDERLMGAGSEPVQTGRVDRYRFTESGEGKPVARAFGRARLGGQVIWATRFKQKTTTSGGSGKGTAPSQPTVTSYSYSVSLALALCEGKINGVTRMWIDGVETALDDVTMRVYRGGVDQLPDPKIEAVEGSGEAPAYRGTAYVVIEDFELAAYGNRVPQFSFEVLRPAQSDPARPRTDLSQMIEAVAMIPGTGEYALATSPVYLKHGTGKHVAANINSPSQKPDILTSLDGLERELPNARTASLVVSWFGNDLRCGQTEIRPKVEQNTVDGTGMAWNVGPTLRSAAASVPLHQGKPVYGGTPCDASVVEAINEMQTRGLGVIFYPFVLMDQLDGNGLSDPWTGATDQPALPWRGRITLSIAPGQAGSPDRTAAARAEVDAFFGSCEPEDFSVTGGAVTYSGPDEWSYRRMVLHSAHLCALAGGVEAFCIGSELPGLTRIRDDMDAFPAVDHLVQLAIDLRAVLGPSCKIGYAADWTEYFGYQPADGSGDVFFNLDPLWAHPDVDFIGIDNYIPLSDWRDGTNHADAGWGSIYDRSYLAANVAGGEGYDWYYASDAARDAQIRTPITDGAYGEPWIYRFKDLLNWWSNPHHNRPGGVRDAAATAWVPQSKPIWFTEFGCPAVDKGPNQPNKFVDPKSGESGLPHYSNGQRDDLAQYQYYAAMYDFWSDPANNPVSGEYGGPMVDMSRACAWAWDARPYPAFPQNTAVWSDGENYELGHWLNGRASARSLAGVVEEICRDAGLDDLDSSGLFGIVRGFAGGDAGTARGALQPLMPAYGFDAFERDGLVRFANRNGQPVASISQSDLATLPEMNADVERVRVSASEGLDAVRLGYLDVDADMALQFAASRHPGAKGGSEGSHSSNVVLTSREAKQVAARWLVEARVSRDRVKLSLPPSLMGVGPGDVVTLDTGGPVETYRIDRALLADGQMLEMVRVEPNVYQAQDTDAEPVRPTQFVAPVPVSHYIMDLPLLTGDELAHAPHVAATSDPWPGGASVYRAASAGTYSHLATMGRPAIMGTTESVLYSAPPGRVDRGSVLRVKLASGALSAVADDAFHLGANRAAIGDGIGEDWEVFQFRDAVLVAPDTYEVSYRLRGQAGTDALDQGDWPAGSVFVLLDDAVEQVDTGLAMRGLAQDFRVGPSTRPVFDPSYVEQSRAISGVGLRPFAPAHLRALKSANGDIVVSWVRRSRIDADNWASMDVPLGEDNESYLVRVFDPQSQLMREAVVGPTGWTYSAAAQAADAASGLIRIEIAQLSVQFGPGLFRKVQVNV